MRNWEEKYEKLKNGEYDSRIDDLKQKIDEKKTTREEYKEYEKLTKSKGNLNQIKNVLEYRDITVKKLENIKNEIEIRQSMKKANEESIKIEVEMNLLSKEMEKISKQLKDPKLNADQKEALSKRQEELYAKRDENNKKYVENQAQISKGLNRDEGLKNYSDKELEIMKLTASSRISKCNMVANSLVNGLSWDSIDLKLDNWNNKKFKAKDDKSVKNWREARKEKVENFKLDIKDPEKISDREEDIKEEGEQNKLPDRTFDDRHPRLAKIKKFFKNIKDKFSKKEVTPEKPEEDKPEKEENKVENDKSFKEYIKEIAEKGIDGISNEKAENKKEQLKKRLEELRKANREAEANKFGKEYAKQSDYRQKDDDEGR